METDRRLIHSSEFYQFASDHKDGVGKTTDNNQVLDTSKDKHDLIVNTKSDTQKDQDKGEDELKTPIHDSNVSIQEKTMANEVLTSKTKPIPPMDSNYDDLNHSKSRDEMISP